MTTASLPAVETPRDSSQGGIPWRLVIGLALISLPALPLLVLHGRLLWQREHYQFFPLVPLGAILLAASRLQGLGQLQPGKKLTTVIALAVTWLLFAAATLLLSPWLGAVSWVLLMAVAIHAVGGWPLMRRLWPAWLFLWLVVPPPFDLDRQLVMSLQARTAQWSSRILDLIGIHHVMQGNVVALPSKRLLVEEACSGINSLFAMLTCTLFFVLWNRRPFTRAVLLVISSVAWVLMANVLRVVCVAYAQDRYGFNLVEGWPHEILGWTLFTLMLVMIWSTDRFLTFLNPMDWIRRRAMPRDARRVAPAAESEKVTRAPNWRSVVMFSPPVVGSFALLGALEIGILLPSATEGASMASLRTRLDALGEDSLPSQIGQWRRVKFDIVKRERNSQLGEHSRIWTYRRDNNVAHFSVDYVFAGWHELSECYTSLGWILNERTITAPQENKTYVESSLSKPFDERGYVLFSLIDDQGRCLTPPSEIEAKSLPARFIDRASERGRYIMDLVGRSNANTELDQQLNPLCYQVQLYTESYAPLTPVDKNNCRAIYLLLRENVQKHGQSQQ